METANKKTLVLIDSNAIIHRAYHALPKNMSTSKGELTNAVYGYALTIIKILEDLKPTHIAASFDISKATFRVEQYAEYKATRVAADQELYDQIPKVKELLGVLNIPIYAVEGYEADDCIGTISDKFEERNPKQLFKDFNVYIVTGDKDAFQLVDGNIYIYWLKKGLSEAGIINRKVIDIEWGLQPEDFIDLKALAGDPSDNIPGAPGIGPKTAVELLKNFDTIDKLYGKMASSLHCSIDDLKVELLNNEIMKQLSTELGLRERIIRILIEFRDQVFLSQSLATINRQAPLDFKLEDCEWGNYDKEKLGDFFEQMQFKSLLKRFGVERVAEPKTKQAKEQKEKDKQLKLL